jgi:hypothetical protein
MAKHTPTPWCWYGDSQGPRSIRQLDGTKELVSPNDDGGFTFTNPEDIPFIIRAVNSHDALVTECKNAIGFVEAARRHLLIPFDTRGEGNKWCDAMVAQLVAALAAAERGTT